MPGLSSTQTLLGYRHLEGFGRRPAAWTCSIPAVVASREAKLQDQRCVSCVCLVCVLCVRHGREAQRVEDPHQDTGDFIAVSVSSGGWDFGFGSDGTSWGALHQVEFGTRLSLAHVEFDSLLLGFPTPAGLPPL
ncbi:unnamed protein product [Discosporangium mesarthrocarpum]